MMGLQQIIRRISISAAVKDFKCPHCNFIDASKQTVKKHVMGVHKTKRPFHCAECGIGFTNFQVMKKHVKTQHGLSISSPYEIVKPQLRAPLYQISALLNYKSTSNIYLASLYPMKSQAFPIQCINKGHEIPIQPKAEEEVKDFEKVIQEWGEFILWVLF